MAGTSDNALTKLKITGYENPDYSGKIDEYQVQFNPARIDESFSVEYVDESVPNATDEVKRFKNRPSKDLKVKLTLDGTGVAAALNGQSGDVVDIPEEIKKFKKVTSDFIGETHDVPFVRLIWGELEFKGRLKNLSVAHTMFRSDGAPLRSVLDATFESSTEAKKQALEAGKASPDLTHVRVVKNGDTLPLMCQKIYKESSCYIKVARFNGLVDFRNLQPGTEIIFPPLL